MEKYKSKVYIKTDAFNRIVRCEGEYTLPKDLTDWILIEEGSPCDRLNLAQSHYFTGGIYTEDFIPRWKYANGEAVLRTDAEIEADRQDIPSPPPTVEDRVTELEEQLLATDEIAVELYEAQLTQEEINIAQDEAIVELYEMMEV